MFYCSSEKETAIKETRLSLKESKTVAEFYNMKDLIILDLSKNFYLSPDGRMKFLHYFVEDISRQLSLKDEKKLLYIPTQIFPAIENPTVSFRIAKFFLTNLPNENQFLVYFYFSTICMVLTL